MKKTTSVWSAITVATATALIVCMPMIASTQQTRETPRPAQTNARSVIKAAKAIVISDDTERLLQDASANEKSFSELKNWLEKDSSSRGHPRYPELSQAMQQLKGGTRVQLVKETEEVRGGAQLRIKWVKTKILVLDAKGNPWFYTVGYVREQPI